VMKMVRPIKAERRRAKGLKFGWWRVKNTSRRRLLSP